MQRYAITNRHLLAADESGSPSLALGAPPLARSLRQGRDSRAAALVQFARQWAARNIDYIQIREKDLSPDALRELTKQIAAAVREHGAHTRVLLNDSAAIALEAGADGVHLPANALPNTAAKARRLFAQAGREAVVSHSCHSVKEVLRVREESQRDPHATAASTLILYAPVFEKLTPQRRIPGQGLESLRAAVHAAGNIPVIALGGVTNENAPACLAAGAAGIAGIRLFLKIDRR